MWSRGSGLRRLLVVGAVSASTLVAVDRDAVGGSFDVTGYDIAMRYQPAEGTLDGVTVVRATAADQLESLTLHLGGPTVRSVAVDASPASFVQAGEKDLVIEPAATIGAGADFLVRITYDGLPGDGWLPTATGGATAFMGRSSAWFPAREDAGDKASFRLSATVPDGWSVVSIGREAPVRRTPTTTTFRWWEPSVDPAHLAVTVDRLTVERSTLPDGTPVVNAYSPGLATATKPLADRLPEILDFLAGRFGRYPFRAAGNVFVQVDDDAPATAPQTRPVYLGAGNEQFMDLHTVVHEQAHQWYGVSVAPAGRADACLSECFASYAPWLWGEAKENADLDARYREQVDANLANPDFWRELYLPGQSPGINLYGKGPLALHALRRQVGDEAFARLLRRWPSEHRGEYVTWPEFERFAEEVTGGELTGFLRAWSRDATVPPDHYLWPGPLSTPR